MKIVEYSNCVEKDNYVRQIDAYEWRAAKYLATLLKENRLQTTLGGWAKLYLLVDGNAIVSIVVLSAQDCIDDPNIMPWLGFFHTAPQYRGKRHGKKLIDYVCEVAREEGYKTIYLATDHVGLYEKYGFVYLENRIDVYGENSRVYKRDISIST